MVLKQKVIISYTLAPCCVTVFQACPRLAPGLVPAVEAVRARPRITCDQPKQAVPEISWPDCLYLQP